MKPLFYALRCGIQRYDWGNPDANGLIPTLVRETGFDPGPGPYAELWMGAHPSLPARLADGRPLDTAIRADAQHFLGPALAQKTQSLPFLLKVLDAQRPLSIQAHPDKSLAKKLHSLNPDIYPDANHKPEFALCIENMSGLIGFRYPDQITKDLAPFTELGHFLGIGSEPTGPEVSAALDSGPSWIRERYSKIMRAEKATIARLTQSVLARPVETHQHALFCRLYELFGETDPGLFSAFFLNHVELAAGQALFLGPNEPHAYLSGQILECMAESDNVVRAGLTSKYCDVETLLSMLHYRTGPPQILNPVDRHDGHSTYNVPVNDFAVLRRDAGGPPSTLRSEGPAILFILDGRLELSWEAAGSVKPPPAQREDFPPGTVLFLPGDLWSLGLQAVIGGPCTAFAATSGKLN